jgi:heme-degrading monooxygenase HmoA
MIARIWRGWTTPDDADAYVAYVDQTGIRGYEATPGNQGAWILRRAQTDRAEILTLSFWDSFDAIRTFAGDDAEQAVFYPEDDRYLIERELRVTHYEIPRFPPGDHPPRPYL